MSFCRDKQIKNYLIFMAIYAVFLIGAGIWFYESQTSAAKAMYLEHDAAVVSSLLEQGVSKEVIAAAVSNEKAGEAGKELLHTLGIREETMGLLLPFFSEFEAHFLITMLSICMGFLVLLFTGTCLFLWIRNRLYLQAEGIVSRYLAHDYSCHLPQHREGELFRLFACVEQLATVLQAQKEGEQKSKEFLKTTISDISHQLKTPLAALFMYQEIIEAEPEHTETVIEFSKKAKAALKRMELLILSLLKITRLDTGNIVFEKRECFVKEIVENAVNELTTRAASEGKQIIVDGNAKQTLFCDMSWTGEAIGNLVKNALDHTKPGGEIRIAWESSPLLLRIFVSDNGTGIAPEDIHHIFKRFYRSRHSLDTQGIGLGLPLAKSIVEGQGGFISVQSIPNQGTTFTISFPYETVR